MKKRIISMLLAGCMILSLAACGNSKSPETKTETKTADNTEAETKAADSGEVWECVIPWPSIGDAPVGLADVEAAVNAITIPEIGVKVVINPIYCFDLPSQQNLMISSGDKLDLALMMFESNASYVNNGSIIELTELYAQNGSNIQNSLGEAVDACAVDGRLYSIPVGNSMGEGYGYLMRSDLLEKNGFDAENQKVTSEEFEEILAAAKESEGSTFYPLAGLLSYQTFIKYDELGNSVSTGVLMLDKDSDTIVNLFETEEYAAYAQKAYELAQKGYISADASSTDAGTDLIKTGNYGGQASGITPGMEQWAANNAGYPMTALTVIDPYSRTTSLSNISWGITVNCDNPQKAMQFIDLMYANNEIGTILTNGLEDASYIVSEEDADGNRIVAYPEGLDTTTIPYYNMFGVWPNNKAQSAPLTLDYFPELEAFNKNMKYSPAFGYTFDTSEYSTDIAAIESVIAQYSDAINGGKVDPSTQLPTFIQALKDAGIDKVMEANQAQYDAWRAAQ